MILNKFYANLSDTIYFKAIKDNSKLVNKGDLFVAIKGSKYNGEDYIREAIKNGASFIISETEVKNFPSLIVANAKETLLSLLNFFYPSHKRLNLVGVTGTDGKTTVSTIINDILSKQETSGLIGTNGIILNKSNYPLKNTTPSNTILYQTLDSFYYRGIENAVLEMSSEGILDNRGMMFSFNACIFTNITREHLNTHKTMKKYLDTKLKLFKNIKDNGVAIINYDMKYRNYILKRVKVKTITYGINGGDYQAKNIITTLDGTLFDLYYKGYFLCQIETSLVGEFNVYNVLASIAYLEHHGIDINIIKNELNDHIKIDGRFIYFKENHRNFIVDFAHTPNGIKQMLKTIQKFHFNHIITILGSSGEKDKGKRKDMGYYASMYSDTLILTSEDPKGESLFSIFHDLQKKIKKDFYLTLSRLDAIKLALSIMKNNDLLIIFGKGNEKYEIIGNNIFKSNDLKMIKDNLNT